MFLVAGSIIVPLIFLFAYKILVSLYGHYEVEKRSGATEFKYDKPYKHDPNKAIDRAKLEIQRKEQLYQYYTDTFNEQPVGQACLRLLNEK